ncbi:MAG: SPOR domain-containing protein [Syntrophobacterales bacterium]|nr:SPOR domain-containing protein [Syntrophobacterales bacterium]
MPQKNGDFEFRLGRFGLVFFTLVIALLLLFFFVCGVIVGKNIESYPKKIAGIPGTIKEKITKSRDTATDTDKKEDEIKFTFYDTLKGSGKDVKEDFADKKVSYSEKYKPPEKYTPPEKKQAGGQYVIQVVSFKDKSRTEALKAKLTDMGYSPKVDEVNLRSSGKWFRVKLQGFATYDDARKVASLVEKKIRGIKCLIIKNRGN